MPSLKAARDHAKRIHCVSNVKTLTLGWLMYAQEFDNKLINGNVGTLAMERTLGVPWIFVPAGGQSVEIEPKIQAIKRGALYPYVGKSVDVYRCPSDRRTVPP